VRPSTASASFVPTRTSPSRALENAPPAPPITSTAAANDQAAELTRAEKWEREHPRDEAIEAPTGVKVIAAAGGKPGEAVYTLEAALALRTPEQMLESLGRTKDGVVIARIVARPLPPGVAKPKSGKVEAQPPVRTPPQLKAHAVDTVAGDRPSLKLRVTFKMQPGDLVYRFDRAAAVLGQGGVVEINVVARGPGELRAAGMTTAEKRLTYVGGLARQLLSMAGDEAVMTSRPKEMSALRCAFTIASTKSPAVPSKPAPTRDDGKASQRKERPATEKDAASTTTATCDLCGGPHVWTECRA
jgi:hypothetical protein